MAMNGSIRANPTHMARFGYANFAVQQTALEVQIQNARRKRIIVAKKRTVAETPVEFGTVNDLMNDLEREIQAIKDGQLSEAKARIVAKNRDLQIRAVELMLAAAKIEARFRPAIGNKLGLSMLADKPILTQ